MKADIALISSIAGIFLTILLFAYEGYQNSGFEYQEGWFMASPE
jgi:hypothetical protein